VSEYLITFKFVKEKVDYFTQFFRAWVGLSGTIADNLEIGRYPNSYAIAIPIFGGFRHHCRCFLAGEYHRFELPEGAIRPKINQFGNVFGCGLVLDPDNKLAIFFTLNGQLLGKILSIIFKIYIAIRASDKYLQ
jgi:hypothetical protein